MLTMLKTQYRHIHFTEMVDEWVCFANERNASGGLVGLGICVYYKPWRKWQFQPEPMTAFTADCCRDIAHFLEQLKGPK